MCKEALSDFNIDTVLQNLAKNRPLFHNERDFQFELAWQIKELYHCEVRLEYYYKTIDNSKRRYIDIIAFDKSYCIAFELKYKTKFFNGKVKNEVYNLKNQYARDLGCAYVLSDLCRLQKLIISKTEIGGRKLNKGYVIFLTNDENYIDIDFGENTLFAKCALKNGETIKGDMRFPKSYNGKDLSQTSAASFKNKDLDFGNEEYLINWADDYNNRTDAAKIYKLIFEITGLCEIISVNSKTVIKTL